MTIRRIGGGGGAGKGMIDTVDITTDAVTATKVDETDTYQMADLRTTTNSPSHGTHTCTATEAVGNAIYVSAVDTVAQADATNEIKMPAIGIVVNKPSSITCYVVTHGLVSGLSGLTAGSRYFVSETAGAITTTAPTTSGSVVQEIGVALSTTELIVEPKAYIVNA